MQTLNDKQLGPVLESFGGFKRTKGDLGPNQIAWLNAKSERFKEAKEQADKAIEHSRASFRIERPGAAKGLEPMEQEVGKAS